MSRGHVRKRAKGSWTIVVPLGRDPVTGRRRQLWRAIKGTRRDAEAKLAEVQHGLNTGGFVKPTKLTLAVFLRRWLQDYAATNVRPRTFEGYRSIIESHLIRKLGSVHLAELQPTHLQAYYSALLTKGRLDGRPGGVSPSTALNHHRVLSEALSHAVRWGLVGRNVAQAVDPPQPRRKEPTILDAPGITRVLEAVQGSIYYPIVHLALFTGVRRSEVLGLRWQAVDLANRTLSIIQVLLQLSNGELIVQEPKTTKSRRLIALSPAAVLGLRAHRDRQEADREVMGLTLEPSELVFAQADGSPLRPNTLTQAFRRSVRRAGLNGVRFHDLRHTHASLMLRQGVHPKIVQERLGHATISTTLDIYSHVTAGLQEAAALKFELEVAEAVPVG